MANDEPARSGATVQTMGLPVDPPSVAPPPEVIEWVRNNAVPVGPEDAPPNAAEASAIGELVEGARVIGFGEIGHGSHEPINYRNRLIHFLVAHHGLTAIALESPLAESKRIYDYVLGGPGNAEQVTRENLGYGFGELQANLEMVRWLRDYNADRLHRPVRVYGIDASTMGISYRSPSGGYGVILADLSAYVARTVPEVSGQVQDGLARFAARFTPADYPSYTEDERRELDVVLQAAEVLFETQRTAMINASSDDEYDWFARIAYDARRLPAFFALWTPEVLATGLSTKGDWISDTIKLLDARDGAMADHTLWVLEREGPDGRILLFQANGHVSAQGMVGSIMRNFPRQPLNTGSVMRERLGDAYRVILCASSRGRSVDDTTIGSLDRAFVAAGQTRALLDIRDAPGDGWWGQMQTIAHGDARIDDFIPVRTFDGVVYFDRVTPAPRLPSDQG